MTYEQYIGSATWASKRAARLAQDDYRCRLCDEDGTRYRLEVHHRPSSYARIPEESVGDDLITVCVRCHDLVTATIRSDRYAVQCYEVGVIPPQVMARQEMRCGLATRELQIGVIGTPDHAQRPDCRPYQQVGEGDQAYFGQAEKDRRRL